MVFTLKNISVALTCFVLIRVQAQVPPPQPVSPAPDAPSSGAPAPTTGLQSFLNSLVQRSNSTSATAQAGKYYEYQSYCRQKNFAPNKYKEIAASVLTALKNNYAEKKTFASFEPVFQALLDSNKLVDASSFLTMEKSNFTPSEQVTAEARLYRMQKKYRNAISILEKYLAENPNDISALKEISLSYEKINNFYEAKTALQDALKIDKKNSAFYLLKLCELESLDSNHVEAEVVCQSAHKVDRNNSLPLVFLGISYREQTNYEKAELYFNKANTVETNEFALTCLGELFWIKKNYSKALEYFQKSSEVNPESGRAQLGAAMSFYELKKFSEALPYFSKACSLDKSIIPAFRAAHKPLEDAKVKAANDYYHAIQKCSTSL